MGYEIKLVLTDDYGIQFHDGRSCGVIATVDLSKPGREVLRVIRESPEAGEYYYYGDDGDTPVREDRYGDALKLVDPIALLRAMQSDGMEYRRYQLAAPMLNVAARTFPRLKVFTYGY